MLGTILKWGAVALLGGVGTAVAIGIAGLVYHAVQERITRRNAGRLIRQHLENGDYNEVNAGLTETEANVIDVTEKDGVAYVAVEVDGEKVGLKSSYGTSLSEGEVLTL